MRVSAWWCLCNNNIPLKHLIVHSTFLVCILQFMRYSNCDMHSLIALEMGLGKALLRECAKVGSQLD